MNKLRLVNPSQLGFAIIIGLGCAFVATEAKRLGNAQWASLGGAAGGVGTLLYGYVKEQLEKKNEQLKEEAKQKDLKICKLEEEIKAIQSFMDRRVDAVEAMVPGIQGIVDNNKESVATSLNAIEQLKGEIYSARAEGQNASKIAEVALSIAQDAQGRINYVLSSGSLVQISQQVTSHELKIAILEKKHEKDFSDRG